jgi:hypothetical protein
MTKVINFEIYDVQSSTNENPGSSSIFANESARFDTTVAEEMDDADKMNLKPIGIFSINIEEILQ